MSISRLACEVYHFREAKISRRRQPTYHFSRKARKKRPRATSSRTRHAWYHLNSPAGRPTSLTDSISLFDVTVIPAVAYSLFSTELRNGAREGIQKRFSCASHLPAAFCLSFSPSTCFGHCISYDLTLYQIFSLLSTFFRTFFRLAKNMANSIDFYLYI